MNNSDHFIIEAHNLSKTYRMGELDIEILKNISLKVERGDFMSVMGPSGSGKSTLLYLLGGLDRPTSGKIRIKGRELSSLNDRDESRLRRRVVGFVFQFYNLVPNLNVEENILLPALLDGKRLSSFKDPLKDILDLIGLAHRRSHTPRELSGGEQQRVAIARSLINDPDIILADEPTGNLDSASGEQILTLLKEVNLEKKKTIIMVTHSQEAAAYSRRIIHLRDGEIC